jgi:dTDP-4-amino-4,6-dideoxy-D-galactose acyltransferase
MIARLGLNAIDDLREALPRLAPVPLAHLPHFNPDERQAYWLNEIRQSLADESCIALASIASARISGFLIYNDSAWDSQIIGRRIGTVKHLAVTSHDPAGGEMLCQLIDELKRTLASRATDCVVCRVSAGDLPAIHALEQRDFLLMDTLVDFVFDFSRTRIEELKSPEQDKHLNIRRAELADMPALMKINERVFADYFGRYHADPRIPPGAATKIYVEWVRFALQDWADWAIVAEIDDAIAGFGLWRKILDAKQNNSPGVAYCDMLVADPAFQARGVGTALMLNGMRIARTSAQYLVGPVHICNYPIQRTLQRLGWRISGARHSLHNWIKP